MSKDIYIIEKTTLGKLKTFDMYSTSDYNPDIRVKVGNSNDQQNEIVWIVEISEEKPENSVSGWWIG